MNSTIENGEQMNYFGLSPFCNGPSHRWSGQTRKPEMIYPCFSQSSKSTSNRLVQSKVIENIWNFLDLVMENNTILFFFSATTCLLEKIQSELVMKVALALFKITARGKINKLKRCNSHPAFFMERKRLSEDWS